MGFLDQHVDTEKISFYFTFLGMKSRNNMKTKQIGQLRLSNQSHFRYVIKNATACIYKVERKRVN